MDWLRRALRSFFFVFRSFPYVHRHGLGHFLFLPGFLGLILGSALAAGVFFGTRLLMHLLIQKLVGPAEWMEPLIWLAAVAQAVLFFAISWRLVASLIVLPSLGGLQDRLEQLTLGQKRDTRLVDDVRNALLGGMKSLLQMAGFPLVAVSSLPLGPFGAIPLALYDGYFLGAGIFDAMLERDYPSTKDRREQLRRLRPEMLGVGLASFVLLLIPFFGMFVSAGMGLVAAFRLRYGDPTAK